MKTALISIAATLTLGLPLALLPVSGQAAEPLFPVTFEPIDFGPLPLAPVLADLNQDGRPDVIVLNQFSNTATIRLLGSGGALGAPYSVVVGGSPSEVVVADLSGDGHLDLAVAHSPRALAVLLGNGDGTFQPRTEYEAANYAIAVAAGDLDGDGDLDLAVPCVVSALVCLFYNNGDGTFAPRVELATAPLPSTVAMGDMNSDGVDDLAVGFNAGPEVYLYRGQTGGSATYAGFLVAAGTSSAVRLGLVDGDGHLDLVTSNPHANALSLFLGDGSGGFGPRTDHPTGAGPSSVALADINGDGKTDLAAPNYGGQSITGLVGNGDGTFGPRQIYPTSYGPNGVVVGDLTNDGVADILATCETPNTACLLVGNGDGTFGTQTQYPVGGPPASVAIGDFNDDGVPDLVTPNGGDHTVSVLLGQGDGSFAAPSLLPTVARPVAVAIADLNRDGLPDLTVASGSPQAVSVYLNAGGGNFAPPSHHAAGGDVVGVDVGDFNQDDNPDIATVNLGYTGTVSILLGNGSGGFAPSMEFETRIGPNSIVLEHLNGDPHLDVAVASWWTPLLGPQEILSPTEDEPGSFVSVFFGNGDGTLGPRTDYGAGHGTSGLTAGDLNGDGHPDLAAGGAQMHCCDMPPPAVTAILNNGDGTFGPELQYPSGSGTRNVAVGDVTGDEIQDLVATRGLVNAVAVVSGLGGGAFGEPTSFGVGATPANLALADLNGDGSLDVAVANATSHTVSILLNQSAPATLEVPIDVQPHTCPNLVYAHAKGVLQVAVMGTDIFDVHDLDPGSVLLDGVASLNDHVQPNDVGTPNVDEETGCNCSDGGKDGHADRLFLFRTQDVVDALGFRSAGGERTLTLTGQLADGTPVRGTDCVRITDSRKDLRPTGESLADGSPGATAPAILWQLYPNPLPRSQSGIFAYRVPDPGAEVSVAVHSVSGRRIAQLASGLRPGGVHTVTWNGRDAAGVRLTPGVYFIKSRVGADQYESRVVLLR